MSITFDYFDMIETDEEAETMGEAVVSVRLKEVFE